MNITDHEKVLRIFMQRFDKIEARLFSLENRLKSIGSTCQEMKGKVVEELADNVSSLVGLKEAVTWRRRSLKFVWLFLFCFGLTATTYYIYKTTDEYLANPTATNVELEHLSEYPYPNLVLCPGSWLDSEKALSKGLSVEALQYSLAYFYSFADTEKINATNARDSFLKFYHSRNYSCLLDYYKDNSVDVLPAESPTDLANKNTSSYICSGCIDNGTLEKVVIRDDMCYSINLKSADAQHFRTWSSAPQILMKVQDRAQGIVQFTSNWRAYLMKDKHLVQPNFPFMTVEPFTSTTLRVGAQRFITLNDNDSKCLGSNKVTENYSAERCIIQCLHKIFKNRFKCHVFAYSANDEFDSPSEYCNYFDNVPGTNKTFEEIFDEHEADLTGSKKGAICVTECPYKCDRVIYTSTVDSKFTIYMDSYNFTGKAKELNMSAVVITVDNTAISQGGILTLTEVSTFSFTTFVSNVGGTLGLFVGGTILTFFQFILFLVNYALDARESKKIKPRTES